VLTIAIFAVSTIAIVNPVSAVFTLGNLTGTYRYHANDFDPHVPGVIGYVWPGGGQNAYGGIPNYAGPNFAPGYQSPYPGGKPSPLAGINQFGNAPSNSWYQLESDAYSPFGAVLTNSTGDLIFALNATYGYVASWDVVAIYIPPGFTVPGPEQVVTSFTNDYSGINVLKASWADRYCPGCTVIIIDADHGLSGNSPILPSYYNHQLLSFTSAGEWYYIRVNGVTAPGTAGRYFFKILFMTGDTTNVGGPEGVSINGPSKNNGMDEAQFIPTQNWPVMLVKGEIDPAIITGTIRYAGYNQTLYSQPIMEAGKVTAVMTTRLDPYTGQQRPDLPLVNAVAYFNATAQGHYEVEGLAPGIYDLYASAAGYPNTLVQTGFTVLRGQSLHFDGYLQPGPVIHGNVFSKHQFGDEPWPNANEALCPGTGFTSTGTTCTPDPNDNQYIKIELYNAPTLNHIPDPSAGSPVSWSPIPCIAGGQEKLYAKRDAGYCGDPRTGANIAFPWHEYVPWNGYGNGIFYQVSSGQGLGYTTTINSNFQDPQGVGPPQHWYVQGGTTTPFHFEFGVKGEYGAPRDLDGMVPQMYATWVNGLTPGRYYARAWTFRYVQSALDGSTFQEYYFDVTPNEWAGDVTLPIDLRLSSWINKTVHFHNVINGITEDPIDTGAGMMAGDLVDANGVVWSYNQTFLGCEGAQTLTNFPNGEFDNCPNNGPYGFSPQGWFQGPVYTTGEGTDWKGHSFDYLEFHHGNHLDGAGLNQRAINTGRANIQWAGANDTYGGENYGIPSGTYQPHVFVLGYIESSPVEFVSVTLSGNPTQVSDHMYRGAGFNLTLYSIDWERPTVSRDWVWGQWGYGYSNVAGTTGSAGTCTPFPLDNNPAAPDSYCSGQQPYPWGTGFTHGAYGGNYANNNGFGQVPPYSPAGNTPIQCVIPYGGTSQNCEPMLGQEIDVGLFHNGTIQDWVSDEEGSLADTLPTYCLFQNDTASYVQMCGGGWNPLYFDPAHQSYVPYGGNANGAFFGEELYRTGFVGGYASGDDQILSQKLFTISALAHYHPQQTPSGGEVMSGISGFIPLYPSALPWNWQYDLRGYTYGYVQDAPYSLYADSSQVADMRINLVIGVNVTVDILFKKEHIITPTDGNMSARVRLFDDSGNLVAEWMSSEGTYVTSNGFARAADGTTQYPFGNLGDPTYTATAGGFGYYTGVGGNIPFPNPLNAYNYLPGGTTELKVLMAGLPMVPAGGQNDGVAEYQAKETYFWDPVYGGACEFDLLCIANPGPTWNAPGFWPNAGILGAPDYQGGWTAEVDFVNWYANNTGGDTSTNGFQGIGVGGSSTVVPNMATCNSAAAVVVYTAGCFSGFPTTGSYVAPTPVVGEVTGVAMQKFTDVWQQTPSYYPPINGLLMGESYHIIPGTTAKSGISLTEDTALNTAIPYAVGHTMAPNHLGPYSQEGVWQISNAHNSGEASAIFEVDLNGLVTGNAFAFNWANEFRTLSWATVSVTGAPGSAGSPWNFYTLDGNYQAYLPPGTYQFTITSPGFASQTYSVAVSSGQTGTGYNMYLQQSNIPVPEFSGLVIAAIAALAASVYVLRRRRK
jgi:hypothetical protein